MSDDEETRPAKRQRTETVSQTTLRKPFSSPLLQKSRPAAAVASPAAQSGPDKGPTTATAAAAAAPAPAESDTPSRVKHSDNPVRQSRRALENEIKAVRNELEVVAQAKRIIAGDQTRKVRELAQRWKMVAQTAAEAAFETLSPSINE